MGLCHRPSNKLIPVGAGDQELYVTELQAVRRTDVKASDLLCISTLMRGHGFV